MSVRLPGKDGIVRQKIKMIGLDLDGTLLTETKELLPYTKEVLRRAVDAGVIVLTATGRPWLGIPEEIREFPGMDYAVTSNGARIVRAKTGEALEEHLLSPETAKKILEIFGKYDTLQEVYFDGLGYAQEEKLEHVERYHKNPHMREYVRQTRVPVPDVLDVIERENRGLDKVQALFADMDERESAWQEISRIEEVVAVGSLKYNIEVNSVGVDKGKGMLSLANMLGIRREEIMACGDGDNDIVMLREVGFGVAMGNADDEVKAAADAITETNDEEGAAKAIERWVLKGGEGLC